MSLKACTPLMVVSLLSPSIHPGIIILMTTKPQTLPKFGEWDVKNPSSADGFTVIFAKASNEKKTNGTVAGAPQKINDNNTNKGPPPKPQPSHEIEPKNRFCCF